MSRYACMICGHEYNSEKGEPVQNIKPGIPFADLASDWNCPVCGAEKKLFRAV